MAHLGVSGSEWRMPLLFSPLESDCCYDSGLQTSCDSGLGLTYESHSLSSDARPLNVSEASLVYGSQIPSTAESEREILEREFHQLNLMTYGEPFRSGNLQGERDAQAQGEFATEGQAVIPTTVSSQEAVEFFTQDEEGDTQLHLAIIKPNVEAALWLISAAWSSNLLNIQNSKYYHTPLHLAVITNQPDIVRSLILHGACTTMRDNQGNTPVHIACERGMLECLKQLTAPFSERERREAAMCGRREQLCVVMHKPLLDSCIKNYEGQTCLHLAQKTPSADRMAIIRYLVQECSVNVNMQEGKCGYTLLHQAVLSNDAEVIGFLLGQGSYIFDINMTCYNGSNALNIANNLGRTEISNWLRHCGAMEKFGSSEGKESDSDDEVMDRFDDLVISGQNRNLHYS